MDMLKGLWVATGDRNVTNGWMGETFGWPFGQPIQGFQRNRGDQSMTTVKSADIAIGLPVMRETINVSVLRSDLDAVMAKSPNCNRMDVIRSLIGITGDIVKAEINSKQVVFSSTSIEEFALKDKLDATLRIDYMTRRYGKSETREALTELINGMIAENRPVAMRNGNEFALRR